MEQEGWQAIEKKIGEMQGKAAAGICDIGKADAALRELRSGLYDLSGLLRKYVNIVRKDEKGGERG